MKKNVLILIIIMVIIIIIIGITLLLLKINNSKNLEEESGDIYSKEEIKEKDYSKEEIKKVEDNSKFYTVTNCIAVYLDTINVNNSSYYKVENNNKVQSVSTEKVAQNIYNLLSKEYIEKNNIQKVDVFKNVDEVKEKVMFVPLKMNVLENSKVQKYIVYGMIENIKYQYIKDLYVIVNLDIENNTFSIEPIKETKKDIEEIKIKNNNESIEVKDNNKYKEVEANDEYVATEYFNSYKKIALSNPELAYKFLNEEYKNKRFGSLEEYKKYIEKNKNEIKGLTLNKYLVIEKEGFKQYVIKDKYENIYTFDTKNLMEYNLKLDTYTIITEEFKNEYNAASEEGKVSLNTNNIIKMMNSRDYHTIYSLLDEDYKKTYFKTEDEFIDYMNRIYSKHYECSIKSKEKEGNTYIQKVFLTDITKKEKFNDETNIMMQIKEGLDFKISFGYISQK